MSVISPTDPSSIMPDPYLDMLPNFAYSMPTQAILLGITTTLLSMLMIHLLFTIRYHWPLSSLNYILQLATVFLSLLRSVLEMEYLIENLRDQPKQWPYMFHFIEQTIPDENWSPVRVGLWQTLNVLVSLSVHVAHIQFLTLLFPSRLEIQLIITLLGPLALIAGFFHYARFLDSGAPQDLMDAIRGTANSALTLLYTLAIFIWGLTLNRERAWRMEGGTAAFGIFALMLGVSGTAVNFVELKEERLKWLPGIVVCILLWQSWVSFWWWVGAGMWDTEAEVVRKREERKRDRELKKIEIKRRKEARIASRSVVGSDLGSGSIVRRRTRLGRHDTTASNRNNIEEHELATFNVTAAAPTSGTSGTQSHHPDDPAYELETLRSQNLRSHDQDHHRTPNTNGSAGHTHTDSSTESTTNISPPVILQPLINFFSPFVTRLVEGHEVAAVRRAIASGARMEPRGNNNENGRRERGEEWGLSALVSRVRSNQATRGWTEEQQGGQRPASCETQEDGDDLGELSRRRPENQDPESGGTHPPNWRARMVRKMRTKDVTDY